ncbi:hypothetical protein GJQ69_07035 [Caproicibacterium lactatifermentans]|jgi:hypothetical protein|uniref:Uncharacterized protein n=2 Tax=Clostridia TaxID=186801 RepID=A0A859DTN6_9FIRM|nr:hypothetical protein GJQ69_07035 [Caproicibacterium lactatifermentans]
MYTPKGKTKQTEETTMTNIYDELRSHFTLGDYNTSISREDFEEAFTKTKESIRFTFNGWDGKSYDGESRSAKVIRCNIPGFESIRFIKVGKHLCFIDEDWMVTEKETGEQHPTTGWLVEVRKA